MMFGKHNEIAQNYINTRRALISAVVGFILSLIMYLICSILVLISVIPEGGIRFTSLLISLLTSYFAGFLTAKNVPMYGLFNGLATGVIYFVITYIFSVIINLSFAFNGQLLVSLITVLAGAALGGIVGINHRASRRRGTRRSSYSPYRRRRR